MATRLITGPTSEPVTLAEAKAHLRLEHSLDDATVTALVLAARQWVEEHCWRGLVLQTWELVVDDFPLGLGLELPKGNLATLPDAGTPPVAVSPVSSVKYIDTDGAEQTLATTEYVVDTATVPGRVLLAYDKSWPSTRDQWNAVVVRYVVGWAVADVPQPIKQATLLLVSQLYEHRTPEVTGTIVSAVRFAIEALLGPYRLNKF